jgi:hypothetical protein
MRTIALFGLVFLVLTAPAFGQVYKWVDKDGNVRYADKPPPEQKDAKPAELRPLTSVQAIAPAPESGATVEERKDAEAAASDGYKVFKFQRPTQDETLSNIGTLLSVKLDISPDLMDGHKIMVTYDGQDFEARASTVTLTNVFRGTHSIQGRIVDQSGRMVAKTEVVTFHVQQNAIIQKLLGPPKK